MDNNTQKKILKLCIWALAGILALALGWHLFKYGAIIIEDGRKGAIMALSAFAIFLVAIGVVLLPKLNELINAIVNELID